MGEAPIDYLTGVLRCLAVSEILVSSDKTLLRWPTFLAHVTSVSNTPMEDVTGVPDTNQDAITGVTRSLETTPP